MDGPRLVLDCKAQLGEGPLWVPETGTLWFLDLLGPALHRYVPRTGAHERHALGGTVPLGCLARGHGRDRLLLARREGVFRLDAHTLEAGFWVDPNERAVEVACNDGKIGPDGALWLCTDDLAEKEPRGVLWRISPDGTAALIDAGFVVGNGPAFSPDGRTMYLADTMGRRILAYDFNAELGEVRDRRVFATFAVDVGYPDGMTVDIEGCLWVAHWGGSRISRYDPAGEIVRAVALPVPNVTSLAFGGPELTTLYVTTAREGMANADLARSPEAGGLFALDSDVPGQVEPAMPA